MMGSIAFGTPRAAPYGGRQDARLEPKYKQSGAIKEGDWSMQRFPCGLFDPMLMACSKNRRLGAATMLVLILSGLKMEIRQASQLLQPCCFNACRITISLSMRVGHEASSTSTINTLAVSAGLNLHHAMDVWRRSLEQFSMSAGYSWVYAADVTHGCMPLMLHMGVCC
jgi:hypothetical protein